MCAWRNGAVVSRCACVCVCMCVCAANVERCPRTERNIREPAVCFHCAVSHHVTWRRMWPCRVRWALRTLLRDRSRAYTVITLGFHRWSMLHRERVGSVIRNVLTQTYDHVDVFKASRTHTHAHTDFTHEAQVLCYRPAEFHTCETAESSVWRLWRELPVLLRVMSLWCHEGYLTWKEECTAMTSEYL